MIQGGEQMDDGGSDGRINKEKSPKGRIEIQSTYPIIFT